MKVVLLAGGTGGAKLAHGLQMVLPPGDLTVIVNVADDMERFGLLVCPDLDTILYTLAGLADREQGWGVAGDTFSALEMFGRYGEEAWFRIGDADLATHVRRDRLLREGSSLTDATAAMAAALGVATHLVPATDDRVRTRIQIDGGEEIDFQEYFVIDELDAGLALAIEALGMRVSVLPTVMVSNDDRARLAAALLELVEGILGE